MKEKEGRGGGLTSATSQEKSLLHIRTDARSIETQKAPSDINPDRIYFVTGLLKTLRTFLDAVNFLEERRGNESRDFSFIFRQAEYL